MTELFFLFFSIIMFILVLSFLVLIHELGHFFAARWAKIKVEEFGLGYPPETVFTLNWIPFGGFVRMEGEEGTQDAAHPNAFYSKTTVQKLVVILAGVTVNFIFGILAFSTVYAISGIPQVIDRARIEVSIPNSPAAQAGLPAGVEIIAVRDADQNVVPIRTNAELITNVQKFIGQTVTIVTTGNCEGLSCTEIAQEFELYVRTPDETPEGEGALGIIFTPYVVSFYPWYEMPFRGAVVGFEQTYFIIVQTFEALKQMVFDFSQKGSLPTEAVGPIGIVHQAVEYRIFDQGPLYLLNFAGVISVSLAIMNLLPIMPLDGGRAVFIVAERILGRKRTEKIEGYAQYVGILFLMFFILVITGRDIWRIFV